MLAKFNEPAPADLLKLHARQLMRQGTDCDRAALRATLAQLPVDDAVDLLESVRGFLDELVDLLRSRGLGERAGLECLRNFAFSTAADCFRVAHNGSVGDHERLGRCLLAHCRQALAGARLFDGSDCLESDKRGGELDRQGLKLIAEEAVEQFKAAGAHTEWARATLVVARLSKNPVLAYQTISFFRNPDSFFALDDWLNIKDFCNVFLTETVGKHFSLFLYSVITSFDCKFACLACRPLLE